MMSFTELEILYYQVANGIMSMTDFEILLLRQHEQGFDIGYKAGLDDGLLQGHSRGYDEGYLDGIHDNE